MYVIPYSMGPIGSPLSKIGVQLTDFNYVMLSMVIMARVSDSIWKVLGDDDFVQCVHSIGAPRPVKSTLRLISFACFCEGVWEQTTPDKEQNFSNVHPTPVWVRSGFP